MAAGYIIAIVVLSIVGLALGGALAYVSVQRDNDDDPEAPPVVLPDLQDLVQKTVKKHLPVTKAAGAKAARLFGKHASEEEDFEKGRYTYSAVDLTAATSIEPMLLGAVPASQSPQRSNFRSHVVVPENSLHKRLWVHSA